MNIGVIPNSVLSPGLFTEMHDFLWSTSTLDWHLRNSEDSFASLEVLSESSHLVCIVDSVH